MSARRALPAAGRRLMGAAFLAMNVALVTLSVAFYLEVFSSTVPVTLETDHVGNLLQAESDVKVRGVIVGKVTEVRPTADGAAVRLALEPDKTELIPSNVSARLTPKTLFGERYVDLVVPEHPSGERLRAGEVIPQDRSETAIEVERVLDDLLPLLTAVEPQKLASTLGVIDHALSGRGEQIGQTLVELEDYVSRFNPALPDLQATLAEFAEATENLNRAAPDLLATLATLTGTSQTLVEQRVNLRRFFGSVTTTSTDLLQYLAAHRDNLIDLADTSRPTLELLAQYSPGVECFLRTMAGLVPLARQAFGEGNPDGRPALHVTLEVAPDRGKYVPNRDEPELIDKRGPHCYQPVAPPEKFPQYPGGPIQDGSEHPPPPRGEDPGATRAVTPAVTRPQAVDGLYLGLPNSPEEAAFIAAIKARSMGSDPAEVPQWAALLLGPTLRGAEVTVR
jgi:phospholipid/cholesterol/gamma-HCH transport system substrate-binding protein